MYFLKCIQTNMCCQNILLCVVSPLHCDQITWDYTARENFSTVSQQLKILINFIDKEGILCLIPISMLGFLPFMDLHKVYTCCCYHCEFICATAQRCMDDTVSLYSFTHLQPLSLILSLPFPLYYSNPQP